MFVPMKIEKKRRPHKQQRLVVCSQADSTIHPSTSTILQHILLAAGARDLQKGRLDVQMDSE